MSGSHRPDHFYRKAKGEGFAARSVYKLEELDQKFRLLRANDRVLDLGAAPGSWLVYAAGRVGSVVAVDRQELRIELPANVKFLQVDLLEVEASDLRKLSPSFDVVLSDVAPPTTGDREGDHTRSMELCEKALELAVVLLRPGGHFTCKMYQGGDTKAFLESARKQFETVKTQKPQASRRESRELFIVGLRRK